MNKRSVLLLAAAGAGAWLAWRTFRTLNGYDFNGKTVLVTGGSRGLGLVLSRELIRQGARVAICARDSAELDRARQDLVTRGGEVLTVPCDITHRPQVDQMLDTVRNHLGPVDVLINNAGVIEVGPMEEMTYADYDEAMATHFWAPLHCTLAVLPEMRQRRAGRIVNISSIGGKVAVPHLLPYDASKFALTGLSEGLRAELAKDGIVVTTVIPGLMRTGSPPNAWFKGRNQEEYAWFALGDALPLSSTSAESAARQILNACKRGDAEVVITWLARAAMAFHGVFPGVTADILGVVNQFLPAPGGIGTQRVRGKDSQSSLAPSWLTALSDRATLQNNEA